MMQAPISIGCTARFGVTQHVFQGLRGVFAGVTLWICGDPLGRSDDPVALYYFVQALSGMARSTGEPLAARCPPSAGIGWWCHGWRARPARPPHLQQSVRRHAPRR
ncbi:hypothetical protein WME94_02795 [Sorangium sp. So ce429]